MKGEIAQFVALSCHGNAFLRGLPISAFFPANSTCKFCDQINFIEFSKSFLGKQNESNIASTPDDWFEHLKRANILGLRLSRVSQNNPGLADRMASAFAGGGGTWSIEAIDGKGWNHVWRSRWEVWNQKAPDRRIWRVTYGQITKAKAVPHASKPLDLVQGDLKGAVLSVYDFSKRNNCGGFTDCFAKALAALDGTSETWLGFHQDLTPTGALSPDAIRILDACQLAWVFGGMGSWNDMGFSGTEGEAYEQVSERLFRAINEAILVATNDSMRIP